MAVSYAELEQKVYHQGPLGKYLVEQLIDWNNKYHRHGPIEHRSLGDSPAVGVMMYEDCGSYDWVPAPEFNSEMNYVHTGKYRPIRRDCMMVARQELPGNRFCMVPSRRERFDKDRTASCIREGTNVT
jgi:hypothetical protein